MSRVMLPVTATALLLLSTKIRSTNRPSAIQQVVSFNGHRSRRR